MSPRTQSCAIGGWLKSGCYGSLAKDRWMKTERWREIEQLYHAARERDPRERDRCLQEACADEEVRGEVESLLGCEAQADGFMETPALEVTAEALAEGRARSMFGRALGHYQIVAFLGAGG